MHYTLVDEAIKLIITPPYWVPPFEQKRYLHVFIRFKIMARNVIKVMNVMGNVIGNIEVKLDSLLINTSK
ncbi:hypothetical protein BM527_06875 [Alteromonas sp. Mex14]|nr:hypothetical protein BM527_06875 [Alteromonas sp. Mex14]